MRWCAGRTRCTAPCARRRGRRRGGPRRSRRAARARAPASRSPPGGPSLSESSRHPSNADLALRGGPLRLAQRLHERLAELLQVLGLAAGDPVLIDHHGLVLDVGSGQLEVHLHGRPGGQRPAAHQPGAEEKLRSVADRGERTLQRVEALDELDEPRVDAQVVRRVPARDEQADVILRPDLVDALVGLDRLLAPVALQLHAGLGPDDVDLVALLAHAVIRDAELRVLEPRSEQASNLPLCHGVPPWSGHRSTSRAPRARAPGKRTGGLYGATGWWQTCRAWRASFP